MQGIIIYTILYTIIKDSYLSNKSSFKPLISNLSILIFYFTNLFLQKITWSIFWIGFKILLISASSLLIYNGQLFK